MGHSALLASATGNSNTVIGFEAMRNSNNSSFNVAVGNLALTNNVGNGNVGIGNFAGFFNGLSTTHTNTTFIGENARSSNLSVQNSTAIGSGAVVTASNQIILGNTSITQIRGNVGFSTFSDARFKGSVKEDIPGLAFVERLRPVSYTLTHSGDPRRISGFLAQDVEKAANALAYSFSGLHLPKNDQDTYSLTYDNFVPSLVRAIQEQQAEIRDLKNQLEELKSRMKSMESLSQRLESLEAMIIKN